MATEHKQLIDDAQEQLAAWNYKGHLDDWRGAEMGLCATIKRLIDALEAAAQPGDLVSRESVLKEVGEMLEHYEGGHEHAVQAASNIDQVRAHIAALPGFQAATQPAPDVADVLWSLRALQASLGGATDAGIYQKRTADLSARLQQERERREKAEDRNRGFSEEAGMYRADLRDVKDDRDALAAKLAEAERERDEYKSYKDRVEVSERERDTDRARLHASDDLAVKNAIERDAYKESAQGAGVVIHRMGAERDALAEDLARVRKLAAEDSTALAAKLADVEGRLQTICTERRRAVEQIDDLRFELRNAIARAEAAEKQCNAMQAQSEHDMQALQSATARAEAAEPYCHIIDQWLICDNQEGATGDAEADWHRLRVAMWREWLDPQISEEAAKLVQRGRDEALAEVKGRRFPIMDGPSIPWYAIEPYEFQAVRNHSQTLEVLASRGGLCAVEAACVLSCRPLHGINNPAMSKDEALEILCRMTGGAK